MQKEINRKSVDKEPKETIDLLTDSDDDDESTDDSQHSIEVSAEVSGAARNSDDGQDKHSNVTDVEQSVSIRHISFSSDCKSKVQHSSF